MRQCYRPIRTPEIKKHWWYHVLMRKGSDWGSHLLLVRMQMRAQPPCKTVCQFLVKFSIPSACDAAVIPPCSHPREIKTYVHTKTCVHTFLTAWSVLTKAWRKPRGPVPGGASAPWIPLSNKKEQTSDPLGNLGHLKGTMLSEKTLSQRVHTGIPFIWCSLSDRVVRKETRPVVARSRGLGRV